MPTSRRNFLFGRRTPPSRWGRFCTRLARSTQGKTTWDTDEYVKVARLVPASQNDVWHAHALCREYGVQLWLDGLAQGPATPSSPILWVEPGTAWASLAVAKEFEPDMDVWRVDGGCRIAQLQAAGFDWMGSIDPAWSVARWLASDLSSRWPLGRGDCSHLMQAAVMMADGSTAILGVFGVNARQPLKNPTVQKMVPKLFELSRCPIAQTMTSAGQWASRYRLDALNSEQANGVNLARILTGHEGTLAWVWTIWLTRTARVVTPLSLNNAFDPRLCNEAVTVFDQQVKQAFDPLGSFAPTR